MPKISAATIAEHNQRTWDLLLDAINQLILEKAFESISMREVATKAGIGRTAIYKYAPDTLTLLVQATRRDSARVDSAIADRAQNMERSPAQRLRDIVVSLLTEHARSTSAFIVMQTIEGSLQREQVTEAVIPLRDRIADRILSVVAAGVEAGEFAPVTDPALTRALMVGVMSAALRKAGSTRSLSVTEADIVATFLTGGLQATGRPDDARPTQQRDELSRPLGESADR